MYTADRFVAHRGYQKHYPENSLLAIEKAIEAGARHIEVDVLLSQDGVLILSHDDFLDRIHGSTGYFAELPACKLFTLNANEPARLGNRFDEVFFSPLEELIPVMEDNPDVHFYIELKVEALLHHSLEYCLSSLRDVLQPVFNQITLISFDPMSVKHAKLDYGFPRAGIVLLDWATRNDVISETNSDIAFVSIKRVPEEGLIETDCPLVIYEVADSTLATHYLQRGAAKIETFAIGEMLASLAD